MKLEGRLPTAIDERRAAGLARDLYGFEAAARALPGEYDDNFHLLAADGTERVLKVMHPARERSLVDLPDICRRIAPKTEQVLPAYTGSTCRSVSGGRITCRTRR